MNITSYLVNIVPITWGPYKLLVKFYKKRELKWFSDKDGKIFQLFLFPLSPRLGLHNYHISSLLRSLLLLGLFSNT